MVKAKFKTKIDKFINTLLVKKDHLMSLLELTYILIDIGFFEDLQDVKSDNEIIAKIIPPYSESRKKGVQLHIIYRLISLDKNKVYHFNGEGDVGEGNDMYVWIINELSRYCDKFKPTEIIEDWGEDDIYIKFKLNNKEYKIQVEDQAHWYDIDFFIKLGKITREAIGYEMFVFDDGQSVYCFFLANEKADLYKYLIDEVKKSIKQIGI